MTYPSLININTDSSANTKIPRDVFEDIKLDIMLSADTIDVMQNVCSADDICARQELFSSLLNDRELLKYLKKLYLFADRIYSLHKGCNTAVCSTEKSVIFAAMMHEVIGFAHLASEIHSDAMLLRRFALYFSEFCSDSRFNEFEQKLSGLISSLDKTHVYTCSIAGKTHYLSVPEATDPSPSGYISKLISLAENFGLKDIKPENTIRICADEGLIAAAARLHPEEFGHAEEFYAEYCDFISDKILSYRSELNFCIEICRLINRIHDAGIPTCFPKISDGRAIELTQAYDITLLEKDEHNIIPNDVELTEKEPLFFLTGANGGGKTTSLRTVGVSVIMFLCGAPAPCAAAEIAPLKCVCTHFPRDERFGLSGRFLDEQSRINEITESADSRTLVLLNETYSTTAEEKAVQCTSELAHTLYSKGVFGIYVTHHSLNIPEEDSGIPFLNVVLDSDGAGRTFKVERKRNTAGSHALDILKKYGLDRETLSERFGI